MSRKGTHIINKLRIDLNLPESQESYQNELSAKVKSNVLSGLEQAGKRLEDHSTSTIIRFEQVTLEVNVQADHLNTLKTDIEEAVLEKIKSAVNKITKPEAGKEEFPEQNTPEKRTQTLLAFYLRTGRFPWWASANESLQLIETELLEMTNHRLENELMPQLRSLPSARRRLAMQFSEETIFKLLKQFVSKSDHAEITTFFYAFKQFIRETKPKISPGKLHYTERLLYNEAIGYAAESVRDKNELMDRWTRVIFDAVPESGKNAGHPWIDWLNSSTEKYPNEWLSTAKKKGLKQFSPSSKKEVFFEDDDLAKQAGTAEIVKELSDSAEEFDIPQAGVVLLHPFTKRFFKNLGLLDDGVFTDDEKRERAVCLLHYLATGEEQFDEPKLILPMMLCGWPIGTPVHRFLPVSEYEKEECLKVLQSAINHWGVLKSTTPDGLRENFLRRNGRLKKGSFGWTLHVEEKTEDILLDQLPWGVSAVAFSWMNQHLTVQWRNQS